MNKLNQHLNDSLSELELSSSMEAEILMNAEKPARKVRFRSRAVVTALLVVCLLSVTAVAAVVSSGWNHGNAEYVSMQELQQTHDLPERFTEKYSDVEGLYILTFTPELSPYPPLSAQAMAHIRPFIANKQFKIPYSSFEEIEGKLGIHLLQTSALTNATNQIITHASSTNPEDFQWSASYELADLDKKHFMAVNVLLDTLEQPEPVTYELWLQEESQVFQYDISALAVTADMVLLRENSVMIYLVYNGIAYEIQVTTGWNSGENPVELACDLLETLH